MMNWKEVTIRPAVLCTVNQHLTGRRLELFIREHRSDSHDRVSVKGDYSTFAEAAEQARKELAEYGYAAAQKPRLSSFVNEAAESLSDLMVDWHGMDDQERFRAVQRVQAYLSGKRS